MYSGKAHIENAVYENGKYKVWIPYDTVPATQVSANVSDYKAYADGSILYMQFPACNISLKASLLVHTGI